MEMVENGYVKLADNLDCGVSVLPKDMVFRIVKVGKMVNVVNELVGAGGFSKGEMEEYFVESSEDEYNDWIKVVSSMYRDEVEYVEEEEELEEDIEKEDVEE